MLIYLTISSVIPIWYHYSLAWKWSSNISCSAGLLVAHFFKFQFSENVFLGPHFSRLFSLNVEMCGFFFFPPLGTLSICHCFRASIISDENSADINSHHCSSACNLPFFFACFEIFLFIIHVMRFNNDEPMCSFLCNYLCSLSFLDM